MAAADRRFNNRPHRTRRRRRRPKWTPEPLPLSPDRTVREGERFDQLQPMSVEPDVAVDICVLHEDDELHHPVKASAAASSCVGTI